MPDLSVYSKLQGFSDYQRANEEFQLKKQMLAQRAQQAASGGDLPAPIQLANEFQRARDAGDVQRMTDIAQFSKIYDRGVMPDSMGGVAPVYGYGDAVGSIEGAKAGYKQQAEKNVDYTMNPQIKAAETSAEANAKADTAFNNTMPVLDQLRGYNEASFEMPYSDTMPVRAAARVLGGEETRAKRTATDLMKQARTDLAAPLAKELGVNPTDKDFQASLDRIFDMDADQNSRAAQIDALEQRSRLRKQSRAPTSDEELADVFDPEGVYTPAKPVILRREGQAPSMSDAVNELRRRGKL